MQPDVLREQQFTLARHLRDPVGNPPPPGIANRRLKVYREIFFNAIESLLANGFPVVRATLGPLDWKDLVRAFYAGHRSRTPLFHEIAGEFVEYLYGRADDAAIAPWLPELAHYESVEQSLFVSDAQLPRHDPTGDLLQGVPLLSPLALPLIYRWPVGDIGPGRIPSVPPEQPTTLLVHRDALHRVQFARIAPLTYHVLSSLQLRVLTGRQHFAAVATQIGVDPAVLEAGGLQMLEQLREQGVVLGTHPVDGG